MIKNSCKLFNNGLKTFNNNSMQLSNRSGGLNSNSESKSSNSEILKQWLRSVLYLPTVAVNIFFTHGETITELCLFLEPDQKTWQFEQQAKHKARAYRTQPDTGCKNSFWIQQLHQLPVKKSNCGKMEPVDEMLVPAQEWF